MVDALVLAAGLGTRMRHLTDEIAKPAIVVEGDSIVARLVKQLLNCEDVGTVYVNVSYQAKSVVDALNTVDIPQGKRVIFLWERKPMGTSWSLMKLLERNCCDVLVIHGDLLLSHGSINKMLKFSIENPQFSILTVHKRSFARARSVIILENEFVVNFHEKGPTSSILPTPHVWSNSGLYFFRRRHLMNYSSDFMIGKSIPDSILPHLISMRQLIWCEFIGHRYSLENPTDVKKARRDFRKKFL